MEWRDEGIILGTRKHGETSAIVEVMTRSHGRHLGLVRGGRSRRMQPLLQAGNHVSLHWWARLDEHMGMYQLEALNFSAARLIESPVALYAMLLAASHLRLLPERDPHAVLYETLTLIIEHGDDAMSAGELLLRFELMLLEELGFGLDLKSCAATGTEENLIYVSPKSGRAVCAEAGAPWADKMLALPEFVKSNKLRPSCESEVFAGFRMTSYFLTRHVWEPRAIIPPESRDSFLTAIGRAFETKPQTDH